jgi:hypothetical protein
MLNEKFMAIHVLMVAVLAYSTWYIVYGERRIMTTSVAFVSGIFTNVVMAIIMLQVSGHVNNDLLIESKTGKQSVQIYGKLSNDCSTHLGSLEGDDQLRKKDMNVYQSLSGEK